MEQKLGLNREDLKFDAGKPKYHLVETDFLNEMATILTKGEEIHPSIDGVPSWKYVEVEAYIDAAYRHLHAIRKGEISSPDMGTTHAAHVAVNMMFVGWLIKEAGK